MVFTVHYSAVDAFGRDSRDLKGDGLRRRREPQQVDIRLAIKEIEKAQQLEEGLAGYPADRAWTCLLQTPD